MLNPNKLTILRIFLLPLPCALLFLETYYAKLAAIGLGSLLGFTDYLDGVLARRHKKITPLGTFLDPVADKIFITTVYLTLTYLGYLSFLPISLIILREIFISYLRSWFFEETKVINLSKLKTFFLMIFAGIVILLNLYFSKYFYLVDYLLWILVFISYLTGIPYFYRVFKKILKFRDQMNLFFEKLPSLIYPLSLVFIFPFTNSFFWIPILCINFYFFKKGLARVSPKWVQEESIFVYLLIILLSLELIFYKKIYFSLFILFIYSFLNDGIETIKLSWKILNLK